MASTGVALGQEEQDAGETAAARALAVEGVKLAQAGQCKDAVDKLERAQKLRHSAIVLGHLGECQVAIGKWVEGSENLRKLLREPLPPEPSPALEQAHQRAAATLKDIKPRIPTMTVTVKASSDAAVTLKLDGKAVPETLLGVPMPADPGEHVLEVEAPGFLKASKSVRLEAGAKEEISFDLKRDPFAAQVKPASSVQPIAPPAAAHRAELALAHAPQEESSGTARALSYVSYGVGAAGLAVGILFGRAAMQAETDLSERCPNKSCPPDAQNDLDAAKAKGTLSTIGFGVGALGVGLGTVLLITSSGSSPRTGAKATQQAALHPRASVGLTRVTLGADF